MSDDHVHDALSQPSSEVAARRLTFQIEDMTGAKTATAGKNVIPDTLYQFHSPSSSDSVSSDFQSHPGIAPTDHQLTISSTIPSNETLNHSTTNTATRHIQNDTHSRSRHPPNHNRNRRRNRPEQPNFSKHSLYGAVEQSFQDEAEYTNYSNRLISTLSSSSVIGKRNGVITNANKKLASRQNGEASRVRATRVHPVVNGNENVFRQNVTRQAGDSRELSPNILRTTSSSSPIENFSRIIGNDGGGGDSEGDDDDDGNFHDDGDVDYGNRNSSNHPDENEGNEEDDEDDGREEEDEDDQIDEQQFMADRLFNRSRVEHERTRLLPPGREALRFRDRDNNLRDRFILGCSFLVVSLIVFVIVVSGITTMLTDPNFPQLEIHSSWPNGGRIPLKYGCFSSSGPAAAVSFPLRWRNVPPSATNLVILFANAGAMLKQTYNDPVHWLVTDIPLNRDEDGVGNADGMLAENASRDTGLMPKGALQHPNIYSNKGIYWPPCSRIRNESSSFVIHAYAIDARASINSYRDAREVMNRFVGVPVAKLTGTYGGENFDGNVEMTVDPQPIQVDTSN